MARRREYDRTAVLDAAMRTFWHQGYEATSVRDLVEACGLSTRSMYDAFGDKERFFDTVLEHYHDCVLMPIIDLFAEHRGLAALEAFVEALTADSTTDGCLFVNTSAERHAVAARSVRRVDDYAVTLRSLIHNKLVEASNDGDFTGDPTARTAQLGMSVAGFLITLRCGGSRTEAATGLRLVVDDIAGS